MPLAGGAPRRLGAVHGLLDGVALAGGELLVSDWLALSPPTPGSLVAYDTEGAPLRELTPAMPAPLRGPADFAYDPAHDELWIPITLDGSIAIAPRQ